MNLDQASKQAERQSQVTEQMYRQGYLLESLEKAIAGLAERVRPVLLDRNPVPVAGGPAKESQKLVELAALMKERNDRLEVHLNALVVMTQGIEL